MKGKWLKPVPAPNAPAVRDENPLMPSGDFNRRIAEFKKARGLAQRFQLTTFCQQQGKHLVTTFERYGPGELFKRISIEEFDPACGRFGGRQQTRQRFDISDVRTWVCICGRPSFVACHCGRISCQPTEGRWSCTPGCGESGPLVPLRSVHGSKGSGGSARTSSALFKSGSGLLLPGK